MTSDLSPWLKHGSRRACENRWFHVDIDDVELPDGRLYEYTVIRRNQHGAAVLAFDERGRVLLQREYRYPVGEAIWQLPAGLIDADETPLQAAKRELWEETGHEASHWHSLGSVWDNPAFENSLIYLYLAQGTTQSSQAQPESEEWLIWEWKEKAWLREAVLQGQVRDRVLLSALGYLWALGERDSG